MARACPRHRSCAPRSRAEGPCMIALAGRRGAVLDRLPEREGASVAGFDVQDVPLWPGQQDRGAEPSGKHAAGVRCRSRPYGWQPVMRYPPQVIDQPAGGSGAARVHDEIGEQCSLLGTPSRKFRPPSTTSTGPSTRHCRRPPPRPRLHASTGRSLVASADRMATRRPVTCSATELRSVVDRVAGSCFRSARLEATDE